MKKCVVKFGGTCLASMDSMDRAAQHCSDILQEYTSLVVVVSAMGRNGDPYATDTLLGLVTDATTEEEERIMSCGELISASVFASVLRSKGIRTISLSGWEAGIVTNDSNGISSVKHIDSLLLQKALVENNCVVVAGFQGKTEKGRISTLGRGGSDTTAIVLAAALNADNIMLFKTVDSVFTADPLKVPNALKVDKISTEDIRQLAWEGAKIIHPRAAEIAGEHKLTIEIHSQKTGEKVTEIVPFILKQGKYITGVASGPEVVQVSANGGENITPHEFFRQLFSFVSATGVSMDMFSVTGNTALFTVPVSQTKVVSTVLEEKGIEFITRGPCAKVSIVGAGMHGMKGVMARFAKALASVSVDMLQTVDSHATISALVLQENSDDALRALHKEFIEK